MIEIVFSGVTTDAQFFIDIWNDCGSGPVDSLLVESSCFFVDVAGELLVDTIGPLPDVAGDYLYLASTLLLLKSRSCISEDEEKRLSEYGDGELNITSQSELVRRLEELQKYLETPKTIIINKVNKVKKIKIQNSH